MQKLITKIKIQKLIISLFYVGFLFLFQYKLGNSKTEIEAIKYSAYVIMVSVFWAGDTIKDSIKAKEND